VDKKVLVIVGPTAVGKTSLGVYLAKKYNGEIISGDSMQIYKHLDVGTAKVTAEEAKGIPHYLIDEKNMNESYSVSEFQEKGRVLIRDISSRGKLPIIVGGTGLYIESLLFDVSHGGDAEPDYDLREQLEKTAQEKGNKALWNQLMSVDEKAAENIHYNNVRRIVRALEVYYVTGQKYSVFQNERNNKTKVYDAKIIGLNTDRTLLYKRINERVDQMVENGLLKEAKMLYENVSEDAQSTKAIGYKEFFNYFGGEKTYEEALSSVKQNSRRFAKRQLTWFRNRIDVDIWANLIEKPQELTTIEKIIDEFTRK